MRCLVTGAHGFIGRFVVESLLESGMAVRAVVRSGGKEAAGGYEVTQLEIGPTTDWTHALKGIRTIVHLADGLRTLEKSRKWNEDEAQRLIEGTTRLAQKAKAAGVTRFIYLSSIKAVAEETKDGVLTEETAPHPTTPYGRGKLKTEEMLRSLVANSTMDLVILRNPVVYGPGAANNMARLVELADTLYPLPFSGLENRRSILAAQNLADAVTTVVTAEGMVNSTFFVHDGPPLSIEEVIAILRSALNRPQRIYKIPRFVWRSASIMPGIGQSTRRLSGKLVLSDNKFRKRFGWTPPLASGEGLHAMVAAYRER